MKQKLLSDIEISQICQELAILLHAGVMLGDGRGQIAQLRGLELRGVALRHAAGGGQMRELILDHGQILAGEITALRSHCYFPPFYWYTISMSAYHRVYEVFYGKMESKYVPAVAGAFAAA